jgi:uncharacterized protein YceK
MKKIFALFFCIVITGCSAVRVVESGIKNEVAGFKQDWQRTFGNERTN